MIRTMVVLCALEGLYSYLRFGQVVAATLALLMVRSDQWSYVVTRFCKSEPPPPPALFAEMFEACSVHHAFYSLLAAYRWTEFKFTLPLCL